MTRKWYLMGVALGFTVGAYFGAANLAFGFPDWVIFPIALITFIVAMIARKVIMYLSQ